MEHISTWLNRTGLGKYAEAFAENDVELDVVARLSDDDLKELGLSLGDRRRLQAAIEELAYAESDTDPRTETDRSSRAPRSSPAAEAERRQLTVMFADLVGSTELSQRLDPEELRELNRAYQDAAKTTIEHYGGYVARYMGDGVLAYFGYPQAHEDDPERAVRAGLAIVREVPALDTAHPLRVRVGIATGPVVVGDLIGEASSQERAVVGETPNLAARVTAVAQHNSVVVAESTYQPVSGLFACSELGAQRLRGFADPQSLWCVDGERQSESRFQALRSGRLASFVGRSSELALLRERWDTSAAGEGQVVALEGEPGVGKSRLIDELRQTLPKDQFTALRFQCSPLHTSSAFFPFVDQIQRASGIRPEEDPERRLDQLEHLLVDSGERNRVLWLFATLLSLPTNRYPALELGPQQFKAEVIETLCAQLAVLSKSRPVLVIFEDAHWVDPTSLEALTALVESVQGLPALIVVTHRPEFEPIWKAHGYVTELRLNHLTRRDGVELIRFVAGGKALPDAIIELILKKTDGVALFVEEVTRAVLEGDFLKETASGYETGAAFPTMVIPSTLSDSLMARLDRLGAAREVAQVAACLGREFSHGLLSAVCETSEEDLRRSIGVLRGHQLISQRGEAPNATYVFKHALIQDAAYESLLFSRRKGIHADVLRILESTYEQAEEVVELMATHAQRAELWDRAVVHLRNCGAKALSRSTGHEACNYYQQALSALVHLPDTRETRTEEFELTLALRDAHFTVGDMDVVLKLGHEAVQLAEALGDQLRWGQALATVAMSMWLGGNSADAVRVNRSALKIADQAKDDSLTISVGFQLGLAAMTLGDYEEAETAFNRVLSDVGDRVHERFGKESYPGATAHSYLAWTLGDCGRFPEGIAHGHEGIQVADSIGHAHSRAGARWSLAHLYINQGSHRDALRLIDEARAIASDAHLGMWPPILRWWRGRILVRTGFAADGVTELESALEARRSGQAVQTWEALLLTDLCEGLTRANRLEEAREKGEEALTLAQRLGERNQAAAALVALGEVGLRVNGHHAPSDRYDQALEIAQALEMKPLQARCRYGRGRVLELSDQMDLSREEYQVAHELFESMGMAFYSTEVEEALGRIG